jgi:hypothetical protein
VIPMEQMQDNLLEGGEETKIGDVIYIKVGDTYYTVYCALIRNFVENLAIFVNYEPDEFQQ